MKILYPSSLVLVTIVFVSSIISSCMTTTSQKQNSEQPMTTAQNTAAPVSGLPESNPFARPSTLPYQAPPFDKITDADFQPAIEEGMRLQRLEIDRIANAGEPATFDNTIVAMERTGALLTRASKVFFAMTQANTNDALQKIQSAVAPMLAAHNDAIFLNDRLFQRVKSIYNGRETSTMTSVQKVLTERYYLDFVRAGANLSETEKEELRGLNQEESKLVTSFQSKVLAATKAGALVVGTKEELDGLTDSEIAAAAKAASDRGLAGKYILALQNTTQQPTMASLKNRSVRERLFKASAFRTEQGDSNDTRELVGQLTKLRSARARLLGYPTYADFVLDNRMAKKPAAAVKLLTDLVAPATAKAKAEAAKMQSLIDSKKEGFTLQPWDWQYYAEQVRKAEYDLDESQIKPYFEMNTVLEKGVFYAANQLFGMTFSERKDIPVYHPDVRVFEVFDHNGTAIGLFYCDLYKRDNKGGGAWMDAFVDGTGLFGTKPVIFNVCNFTKPAAGEPALLSYDNVTTMFHEFGHALHGLLTAVEYPRLTGTNTATDFVEFPSQINENWALYPSVLKNYAMHYKTGEPMPAELVEKIRKAQTFNQGFGTTEYLAAALLDLSWNTIAPGAEPASVGEFETASLQRFNVALSTVPPRYRSSYFAHVWFGGYAAGYYSYMWSEVISHDAYAWFTENGGLTRENGDKFRAMVLSRGGTEDAGAMYRAFRGRDPIVRPLLEARGLTE